MGVPLGNLAFSPFDKKNAYNGSTPQADGRLGAANPILETCKELGVTPDSTAMSDLQNLYVAWGGMLQLDSSLGSAGFPAAGR